MTKINPKFQTRTKGTLSIKEFVKPQVAPIAVNYMHGYEHLPEDIKELVRIHTFKRPHGSGAVDQFVQQFLIEPFTNNSSRPSVHVHTRRSKDGVPLAVVITTDVTSRTLFSAHVDTVHRTAGRQSVEYDHEMGIMLKTQNAGATDNDCLGADDGAGVWVLLQMIRADIPGTYAFHYGEEVGGIGSSTIAREHTAWLAQFDRAIAVDRKGTEDVITHQGWGRCCSDAFAKALAEQLNAYGHAFKPSNGGVFTDTANYTDDIPECTNLSCGYDAQHTPHENLDVEFLIRLKDAMIEVDWESLPTVRRAGDTESLYSAYGGYGSNFGTYRRAPIEKYTPEEVDGAEELDRLAVMSTEAIKGWVLRTPAAEIAKTLAFAIDRIYELEDAVATLTEDLDYYTVLEENEKMRGGDDDFDDGKGIDQW